MVKLNEVEKDDKREVFRQHPILWDFQDVFPKYLPRLPHVREFDFIIDLMVGTKPIHRSLYRMSPIEL